MLTFTSHDFWSGEPIDVVDPGSAAWSQRIVGTGRGEFVFPLRDRERRFSDDVAEARAIARDLFRRRSRWISVADDADAVGFAGVIERCRYVRKTGALHVTASQARKVLSWRQTAGVNIPAPGGDLKATGLSASGYARRVLQRIQHWSPEWQIASFDLPPDGTGNINLDANWYDYLYAEDLISSLEDRGFEVYARPYKKASGFLAHQWMVSPKITTGEVDLPADVAEALAFDLEETDDSQDQVTGVIVRANGSGSDMITRWAGEPTAEGIPICDVGVDAPDVHDGAAAQQIADAEFAARRKEVVQWSLSAGNVDLADVLPGKVFDLEVYDDEWIEDGPRAQRVIALSGGKTSFVKPEVQPHGS